MVPVYLVILFYKQKEFNMKQLVVCRVTATCLANIYMVNNAFFKYKQMEDYMRSLMLDFGIKFLLLADSLCPDICRWKVEPSPCDCMSCQSETL